MDDKIKGAFKSSKKGQVWTIDFVAGIVAISLILLLFILIWNTIAIRWTSIEQQNTMQANAYFASESLLATRGDPQNWETTTNISSVYAIGIVNGRNELNTMKLNTLVSLNATSYSIIKARLGLEQYDFGMNITDLNRDVSYYEFGKFSGGNANESLAFDRLAILNGQPVIVHMEIWDQ